jgi:hypothetical protein
MQKKPSESAAKYSPYVASPSVFDEEAGEQDSNELNPEEKKPDSSIN